MVVSVGSLNGAPSEMPAVTLTKWMNTRIGRSANGNSGSPFRSWPQGRRAHLRLACGVDEDPETLSDEERRAKNEVLFRTVNEAIEQQALRFASIDDEYEFVCECSSVGCVERVTLT